MLPRSFLRTRDSVSQEGAPLVSMRADFGAKASLAPPASIFLAVASGSPVFPLRILSLLSSFHLFTTPSGVCGLLPPRPMTPSSREPRSPGDPGQQLPTPPASPLLPIPQPSPAPAQLLFHSRTISALERRQPVSASAAATAAAAGGARSLPALAGLALPPVPDPEVGANAFCTAPVSQANPSRSPMLGALRYFATSSGMVARALEDSTSTSASGEGDGDGAGLPTGGGAAAASAAERLLAIARGAVEALVERGSSLEAVGTETGARVVGGAAPHAG
mmetsp:Transcript_35996/g.92025  ORF Transcript_35996/g.92025 Transcript_35996/m.92025 type:complete len:277 (-) Transcript_35996:498-1328(-)